MPPRNRMKAEGKMQEGKKKRGTDFISHLPKELALDVLSYLEPKDLLRTAQTSSHWQKITCCGKRNVRRQGSHMAALPGS